MVEILMVSLTRNSNVNELKYSSRAQVHNILFLF